MCGMRGSSTDQLRPDHRLLVLLLVGKEHGLHVIGRKAAFRLSATPVEEEGNAIGALDQRSFFRKTATLRHVDNATQRSRIKAAMSMPPTLPKNRWYTAPV